MTLRPSLRRRLLASLAAGTLTAAASYTAVVLGFFFGVGAATSEWAIIAPVFAESAILLLLLVATAGFAGAFSSARRSWPIGFAAAILAAYLGTAVRLALGGDATGFVSALPTFIGFNLPFVFAATIATATLGARSYAAVLTARRADDSGWGRASVSRTALVRPPSSTLARGQVTHITRKRISLTKARTQWDAYLGALESEGFTVREVELADSHPDSVFIEDTAVVLGQTAVIASPGAESRRGEQDAVAVVFDQLGLETRRIRLPGTLDGGDVLKVGTTIYVGRGGRTNAEGIRQFRSIAGELGYTVVAVPVTRALHLKSAVTALPDGTVIGHASLVDNPAIFDRYLEVPEVEGVAVVVLSASAVLMSAAAKKTAALIADFGYRVVTVDISEFEKLEGCGPACQCASADPRGAACIVGRSVCILKGCSGSETPLTAYIRVAHRRTQ